MKKNATFAVLGGGSWATAIVKMLTNNQEKVGWYMRNSDAIGYLKIQKHNPNYLTSVEFKIEQLVLTDDINEAVNFADILIFAVPSAFLVGELEKLTTSIKNKIIFSAIKGIVPESGKIVGEHFHETFGIPFTNIGVITGPCHAEEVAMERLSYLTIACADKDKAEFVAKNLSSNYIKTNISKDII